MLFEDMLVIDAACLYPRLTRAGALNSFDVIDGATIKPLIGEDGRAPAPPDSSGHNWHRTQASPGNDPATTVYYSHKGTRRAKS
jgi:hypothetical protein